jgi:hypothetical protein
MAVAEYGVAIMEPVPGAGGQPAMPGPEPFVAADYGVPALEPEPLMGVPEYGAPVLPPEPAVAVEPDVPVSADPLPDAGASTDAGVGGASSDAGTAGAGLPMMEPEPLPVAEYGVPPLSLD